MKSDRLTSSELRMPSYIDLVQYGQPPKRIEFQYGSVTVTDDATKRRFRLFSARRQGGNGVVWQASEVDMSHKKVQECAVKTLRRLDPLRIARFDNEVRIHRELTHPRIAVFHGHGRHKFADAADTLAAVPWAAMALGGANLWTHIEDNGALPLATALRIAIQAAEAIEYLHSRELIHRDIKPANFVWSTPIAQADILMIDFGLAKYTGEDVALRELQVFTRDGESVGPQNWMSPELLAYARDNKHPVDHRSDLFQLGLLIWYLVTDTVLAGTPSERFDPTGGGVHGIVSKLCQQDPVQRFSNATEVLAELRAVQSSLARSA